MIVAVDFGLKRIGMARSDDGETWAFPHKTLEGNDLETKLIIELKKIGPRVVVLGLPRNMDGTEGEMAVAVRALGQRLEDVGFTVDFWDERLTSRLVSRQDPRSLKKAIKDKGKVDLMSAVLILQEYINARRRTNEPQ